MAREGGARGFFFFSLVNGQGRGCQGFFFFFISEWPGKGVPGVFFWEAVKSS